MWGEFVVTPLTLILITLVIVLLIVGGVLAYQRLMPVFELGLRSFISRDNENTMLLVDGMIVDADPLTPRLTQPELRLLNQLNFRVMICHWWKSSAHLSHPSSTGLPKPSKNCALKDGYNHEC